MTFGLSVQNIEGVLVVALPSDLTDTVADAIQTDVLRRVERDGAEGLVLDVGALDIVDSYVARALSQTAQMVKLMGVETIVAAMRPEVAATLVRMGYTLPDIRTALDVEEGLLLLRSAGARG